MIKLNILVMVALASSASFAANMETIYKCYTSVAAKLAPADNKLKGNGMIAVNGKYGSDNGFFFFDQDTAYFCKLPEKPQRTENDHNYYYLKLKVNGATSYVTYSQFPNGNDDSAINWAPQPFRAISDNYVDVTCPSTLDDKSREVMYDHLRKIIPQMHMYLLKSKHFTRGDKNVTEKAYIQALNRCTSIREINPEVASELKKLDPPKPMPKQIPKSTGRSK